MPCKLRWVDVAKKSIWRRSISRVELWNCLNAHLRYRFEITLYTSAKKIQHLILNSFVYFSPSKIRLLVFLYFQWHSWVWVSSELRSSDIQPSPFTFISDCIFWSTHYPSFICHSDRNLLRMFNQAQKTVRRQTKNQLQVPWSYYNIWCHMNDHVTWQSRDTKCNVTCYVTWFLMDLSKHRRGLNYFSKHFKFIQNSRSKSIGFI